MTKIGKTGKQGRNSSVPDRPQSLRGWPGYRTRDGRSGLDPIDNDAEGGHMTGVILHNLLAGRLRTRNPVYLTVMAFVGLVCVVPVLLAAMEAFRGDILPLGAWVVVTIAGLLGIVMLVNLIRKLIHLRNK